MDFLVIGIIASVIGVVLVFFQDSIANVGQSVDNFIANQWTAYGLIAVGIILIFLPAFSKRGIRAIGEI
jgi:hypothetical protein